MQGCSELPPIIPNIEDRPLIEPEGKTQWHEIPTLGKGRRPASVLSCLLKKNYPGIVQYKGKSVIATTWNHYKADKDSNGRSKADVVEEGFWLRFKHQPSQDQARAAKVHVRKCCGVLLGWLKYYARIQAIMDHCRKVEGVQICDKRAGLRYLSKEEYLAQQPEWCDQMAWDAMATVWVDPEWIEKSKTNRANRKTPKFKPHRGGSNSIATVRQKLSKKFGREVSAIEAWVHTHRGSNPEDTNTLNTEEATLCLERYKTKATELNGPNFDWMNSPVDSRALYECSCGRPHGKWETFNGMVDDSEAMAKIKRRSTSSTANKRRRQEEDDHERARLIKDARIAKEYAQRVLEWSSGQDSYNNTIKLILESVIQHTGMPLPVAIPHPPPPPPPPTYGVYHSADQSTVNCRRPARRRRRTGRRGGGLHGGRRGSTGGRAAAAVGGRRGGAGGRAACAAAAASRRTAPARTPAPFSDPPSAYVNQHISI